MFDADTTRMIGLPYGKKNYDTMLSRFHPIRSVFGENMNYGIPERYGRTDGQINR